jgi:predicted transcriptional regulator
MSARVSGVRKITIALPGELVEYADRLARSRGASRSQVISQALARQQESEQARLAAEGYQFYAGEATEFAEASLSAIGAAWHTPASDEWNDSDGR